MKGAGTGRTTEAPLLSVTETAAVLGMSPQRYYALAREGRVPAVRLSPGRLVVPRAALDRWIAEKAEQALAEVEQ